MSFHITDDILKMSPLQITAHTQLSMIVHVIKFCF